MRTLAAACPQQPGTRGSRNRNRVAWRAHAFLRMSAALAMSVAAAVVVAPSSAVAADTCGSWQRGYTCAIPAGAATFTGSTGAALKAAIKAVPAGGWLKVGSATITGNVLLSGSDIKPGITLVNAPGTNPTIVGAVDMSDGRDWNWFGIDVTYPASPSSTHMVKFDGGSGWEVAYSEFHDARCYTLVRPGQGATNWRLHHNRVENNRPANGTNQDHALYVSGEVARQNGRIDHNLIGGTPNGRGVKIGGPSSGGGDIGGVRVDHNTIHDSDGPSAVQVSNGATANAIDGNVVYGSGSSTAFTDGAGSRAGNVYQGNVSDIRTGPNTANLRDGGGNAVLPTSQLQDPVLMAARGLGHEAP